MEKSIFVNHILYTPCEQCPIEIYCKCSRAQACHTTAGEYYDLIISLRGVFVWPKETK